MVVVVGGGGLWGAGGLARCGLVVGCGEHGVVRGGHRGVGALDAGPDGLVELLHVDLVFLG